MDLLAASEIEELEHRRNEGHGEETANDRHVGALLVRRLLGAVEGALNLPKGLTNELALCISPHGNCGRSRRICPPPQPEPPPP